MTAPIERKRESRPDRDEIEVVRVDRAVVVDAPASELWRCLTRLDELGSWLGLELDGDGPTLQVGSAARAVEPDGSVRHLLVSELDEGARVAWHWWRDGGELSAVEISVEPVEGEGTTVVRVVETLARAAAGAGGRGAVHPTIGEVVAGIDGGWASVLPALSARLASKLGVA